MPDSEGNLLSSHLMIASHGDMLKQVQAWGIAVQIELSFGFIGECRYPQNRKPTIPELQDIVASFDTLSAGLMSIVD